MSIYCLNKQKPLIKSAEDGPDNEKKNRESFTLIELIVVIAIIAILAAIIAPNVFTPLEIARLDKNNRTPLGIPYL